MNILSIGSDRKLFEEGSPVGKRIKGYAANVDQLDTIVLSTRRHRIRESFRVASNAWAYPTNSFSRWLYVRDAAAVALRDLRGRHYDVVTAQDPFESGLAAKRIAKRLGARLHVQIHTDFLHSHFAQQSLLNNIRIHIANAVIPQADCIRVVSEKIQRTLQEHYQLRNMPTVLPIFVDVEHFKNADSTFDLRKKYSQFEIILLMVGRLESEKRFEMALDALAEAVKDFPKAGLVVVGEGSEHTRLQERARTLGILNNVVFEGWKKDLVSYYRGANLLLVTSRYEGYGMTIVEALASGCPVLSTDVGIAREAGAVVASDDADFVAQLKAFLGGKYFPAELKNYPYTNRGGYDESIVTAWKRCLL